jgi:SSS family solute:Na+ symporter
MMGFSALLGVPYAVPMVWCVLIRRVPDWAAWSAVLAGIAAAALAGSAPLWALSWLEAGSPLAEFAGWMRDHRFVSVTLAGSLASTAWYFGAAWLFRNKLVPERTAEIDAFFAQMHSPVVEQGTAGEAENARGTAGIGRLCGLYAAFILVLALLPNGWAARGAIVFCALFVGGAGFLLIRADGRPRP